MGECELISLRELARRVGVSEREARRWRDEEGLRVYQTGRRRQTVLWHEFKAWLDSRVVDDAKVTD